LLFSMNAVAAEVTIVAAEYSPYEFIENGNWVGIDVDIVREALKRLGHTMVIEDVPWKRCLYMMEHGAAEGILSIFITEERAKFLYYPNDNLSFEKNVIFAHEESDIVINSLDDLKGKSLGTRSEFSYGEQFDKFQGLTKDESLSTEMLLQKFDKDRTELIIGNDLVITHLNKRLGLRPIKVVFVVSEDPLFIGFSKANPMGKELQDGFNKVLPEMKKDGTIDQIFSKYR